MLGIILLGFLIGLRHALEADHVAAVASLAVRARSRSEALRHGLAWGLGHALTLLLVGALVIGLELNFSPQLASLLELLVGLMLVALGVDVLRRLFGHQLGLRLADDGRMAALRRVRPSQRSGSEGYGLPWRALLVGLMHGLAGSAALIVLALQSVVSPGQSMVYVLLFGLGSTLGMALLTLLMSVPMRYVDGDFAWLNRGFQGSLGLFTIGLGMFITVVSAEAMATL